MQHQSFMWHQVASDTRAAVITEGKTGSQFCSPLLATMRWEQCDGEGEGAGEANL